ncbi:MAG: site-specific integrase [Actinomycetales bacterium]|nr:site-specific integrase [Candidatus Phosphoribacter baldrii]
MTTDESPPSPTRHTGGGNRTGTRKAFGNIRRLPSKRWQARFNGPDGREHRAPTTFETKGDARAWLDMQRADITRAQWLPEVATAQTFRATAERWLTRPKDDDYKPRTLAHYRKLMDAFLYPTFGDTPVGKITVDDVDRWYEAFPKSSPTYRAHAYSLLKSVMAYAVLKRAARANPCQIEGAGAARRVKIIKPATLTELEAIAAAMPERYRPMVLLSSWCALRFGELTELRRKDLALEAEVIHVRRGVVRVNGEFVIGSPKSDAGVRDVAIPPHLIPMLKAHRDGMPLRGPDALVFPAADGVSHIAPSTLYRVYYPAREAAGRPDLRWHDLRHTGAVLAAQTGATLAELMSRLGHSTPQAALRYQHTAKGRDAEIARNLSRMVEDSM